MKRLTIILLALCLTCLLFSACKEVPAPASSDSESEAEDYMPFTGNGYIYRWQKQNVIVIAMIDPGAILGYDPSDPIAFKAGVNQWVPLLNSMGITLVYQTASLNSDIVVQWDDGTGLEISLGVVGFAQIRTDSVPTRRIVMTTRLNYDNSPHSSATITEVASHEFGHMLGIWSHSFDPADRMYPYVTGRTELNGRDIATMAYVYSLTADVNLSSWPQNTMSVPILPAGISPFRMKCSFGYEHLQSIDNYEPMIYETYP